MEVFDLVGKQLGDYVLESKLASGGMAHIYIGQDTKLGRKAAVKVLTPDMNKADESLAVRFEREARAVAQVEHDNIVAIYQYGEQDDLYFIAMRYIEGNDLADELRELRERGEVMPVKRALNILSQVAAALDFAHSRGIVHRDVKPSNVLLGHDDKAVLSDFGLVLWESVDQTLGTAFGTPRYISPEQATDSQSAVPQSDIYSLAVIMYEILTGEPLFSGESPMEVALAHITETPLPPRAINPKIPAAAQEEILKGLSKEPSQRHKTATEFVEKVTRAYISAQTKDMPDTLPLRPADAPEPGTGASILKGWDDPNTEAPTQQPGTANVSKAKTTPQQAALRGPLIAVVVGIVAIAAFILLSSGTPQTSTPSATNTGDTDNPSEVGAVPGGGILVELLYVPRALVIRNAGEQTIAIDDLRMVGSDPSDSLSNEDGSRLGLTLAPGDCTVIGSGANDTADTSDCDDIRQVTLATGSTRFWEADSADDETFTIYQSDDEIATCQTVGRAVRRLDGATCTIRWPHLAGE